MTALEAFGREAVFRLRICISGTELGPDDGLLRPPRITTPRFCIRLRKGGGAVIGGLITVAQALAVCFAALHRQSPPTVSLSTGDPVPHLRLTGERPVHTWPRIITKGQTATIFWCNPNASEVLVEQAAEDGARRPLLFPIGRFRRKTPFRCPRL